MPTGRPPYRRIVIVSSDPRRRKVLLVDARQWARFMPKHKEEKQS